MMILSLSSLAKEAGYIAEGERNLLGAIQNARALEENFAALDALHRGAFAFLAFHPAADKQVVDYVVEGSLGDDAGSHILALFLEGGKVPQVARELRPADPLYGVELRSEAHPAYALADHFFLDGARPQLPGLVFFDSLAAPTHSIYVPLDGADAAAIRSQCRKVFDAANRSGRQCGGSIDPRQESLAKNGDGAGRTWQLDFDWFAARLIELDMAYRRAGEQGVRAAAFVAGAWIVKNAGALVAAIPKLVGFAAKAKSGGAAP